MTVSLPDTVSDALIRTGMATRAQVQPRTVYVNRGGSPVASNATALPPPPPGFVPPKWFPLLRLAMTDPEFYGACLFGPRGSGKTTAVHVLSKQMGVPLVTYQAAAGCTIDDLIGVRDLVDGRTTFTPGPLPEAMGTDCWLLIEEANVMHPGVFSKLNTLTDGSGDTLRLPDGKRISVGARFRVVLAFNEGAAYSGTREVNAALRDRLQPIYADYLDPKDEESILIARTGCDALSAKKLVTFARSVRMMRAQLGFDLSPRALIRVLQLQAKLGMSWGEAFEAGILNLVGDPVDKKPQRDALGNLAGNAGLSGWNRPTFVPVASSRPAPVTSSVSSDETVGGER